MSFRECYVSGCKSITGHVVDGRKLSFHTLPKNYAASTIWIDNINRPSPRSGSWKNVRLCSRHFVDGKPTKENPYPVLHMGRRGPHLVSAEWNGIDAFQSLSATCSKRHPQAMDDPTNMDDGSDDSAGNFRPSVPTCCVPGCPSRTDRIQGCFNFPSNQEKRRIWIENIHRPGWTPSIISKVCRKHFVDGRPTEANPHPTILLPKIKHAPAMAERGIVDNFMGQKEPKLPRVCYQKAGITVTAPAVDQSMYRLSKTFVLLAPDPSMNFVAMATVAKTEGACSRHVEIHQQPPLNFMVEAPRMFPKNAYTTIEDEPLTSSSPLNGHSTTFSMKREIDSPSASVISSNGSIDQSLSPWNQSIAFAVIKSEPVDPDSKPQRFEHQDCTDPRESAISADFEPAWIAHAKEEPFDSSSDHERCGVDLGRDSCLKTELSNLFRFSDE